MRKSLLSLAAVGASSLWPLTAVAQEPPKIQVPDPGVSQIMTMEGRYVRIAYNNEGLVTLGYKLANLSVGEAWMLLEVGFALREGVPDYDLTREAISVTTPDDKTIPLPTIAEYRQGDVRALKQRERVQRDSIENYFPPNGVAVNGMWFRPSSTVVGVVLLLLVAFDLWAWRLRILKGWFVPRPDLRGTWRVELQSDWKDPETDKVIDPFVAYLVVRQTFSSLSIRMLTAESASELVAAEIKKASDGTYRVAAIYRNEPKLSVRDRSPMHYGAIVLDVQGDPVNELVGYYWTDRNSRGELRTLARHDSIAGSFKQAQTLLPPGAPVTSATSIASESKAPGEAQQGKARRG